MKTEKHGEFLMSWETLSRVASASSLTYSLALMAVSAPVFKQILVQISYIIMNNFR